MVSEGQSMRKDLTFQELRRFLFASTGELTDHKKLSAIDACDNLVGELDRLDAIGELLTIANDELSQEHVISTGLLLKDVHLRMRTILDLWNAKLGRGRKG